VLREARQGTTKEVKTVEKLDIVFTMSNLNKKISRKGGGGRGRGRGGVKGGIKREGGGASKWASLRSKNKTEE
jgi:hypothetical protein